ncbi:hypothetical protein S7711_09460 [Stachybotrys chartarum IBT 7711]|uniref:F-box domain-containing protein n=1 Tax=Stachybotrys chartarum (strain CBS 109288 / IBT 7711) TaxID=1280523 RepID=A0A084B4N0_STACB|nr:hypothetical protein S7711_09460 [Stachybotrys chartarum IBT 7711]
MANESIYQSEGTYSQLPVELVDEICAYLDNCHIKQLRLRCTFFARSTRLRFRRAFLSPNPRNIDVFRAIARHPVFHGDVAEIVLDDALLPAAGCIVNVNQVELCLRAGPNAQGCDADHPPSWFHMLCHDNITELLDLNAVPRAERWRALQMPWREAWQLYQGLVEAQAAVLETRAYQRALKYGLARFTALRKITISGATYGRAFNPLYETPLLRSLPPLFNYPTPRGWIADEITWPVCPAWKDEGGGWIGFRTVMRALAKNRDCGRVVEVAVDAHGLDTGLNVNVFKDDWRTLRDFRTVLARPGFKSLQLDLMMFGEEHASPPFQWLKGESGTGSGRLGHALAAAADGLGLESLSLNGNMQPTTAWVWQPTTRCAPVQSIFPPSSLSRLRHFGFSGFWVSQDMLIQDLLRRLPQTIETVELSCLDFKQGSYLGLLHDIYRLLGWEQRANRPRLSIRLPINEPMCGELLSIDKEVDEYLYGDGDNPFGQALGDRPVGETMRELGMGIVMHNFGSYIPMKAPEET